MTKKIGCTIIPKRQNDKNLGKGQNYENHNVENQKDLRKLCRRSEHRKE